MRSNLIASFLLPLLFVCSSVLAASPPSELLDDFRQGGASKRHRALYLLATQQQATDVVIPILVRAIAERDVAPGFEWISVGDAQHFLAYYEEHAVIPLLTLLSDSDSNVKRRAADTFDILPIKSGQAAERLQEVALDATEDCMVRFASLQAYGRVEPDGQRLAATLNWVLADDEPLPGDSNHSINTDDAFIPCGAEDGIDFRALAIRIAGERRVRDETVVREIVRALSDQHERAGRFEYSLQIRFDALIAIGRIGAPPADAAVPKVRLLLQDDDDAMVQIAAAFALVRLSRESEEGRSMLDAFAADYRESGRAASCASSLLNELAELGEPMEWALPLLSGLCVLTDRDEPRYASTIRRHAIRALAATDDPKALAMLIVVLRSADSMDRILAAQGIGRLKTDATPAVDELVRALRDERGPLSRQARASAASALGDIGPPASAAIAVLDEIVRNEAKHDWYLVEAARKAVERIQGQ